MEQPAARLTRLGVIDLGSNTGRLILCLRQVHGIPLIVDEAQVSLRLAEGLQQNGAIGRPAVDRALVALRAFRVAAERFGVERLLAVGTSALRDATNGAEVAAELERESGVPIRILSGEQEAFYGYLAAANSLPLRDGLIFDLGGGSLELSFVRGHALERAASLPLGALRLHERFLRSDPPSSGEVAALRDHVEQALRGAGVRKLAAGETLAGAGGTIRALAKLVRKASGAPSIRLHGYAIDAGRQRDLARTLAGQTAQQRRRVPGLAPERAEIIAAGALIVQAVLHVTGARSLLVCGQGLREGLAYEAFRVHHRSPVIRDVRRAGIEAFRERYVTGALRAFSHEGHDHDEHDAHAAPLYAGLRGPHPSDGVEPLALRLLEKLAPVASVGAADRELLAAAAALCDAGRAISLYRWPEHAVYLLTNGDLNGYTQREAITIGLLIAAQAGVRVEPPRGLGQVEEGAAFEVMTLALGLARWLRRFGVEAETPLSVLAPSGALLVVLPHHVPLIADEWEEGLARACRRAFDRELRVSRVGD
jgi:exopolyphosphatase/guanosine-5'-triphosphate,3'-diphosphate pyrophosphatase